MKNCPCAVRLPPVRQEGRWGIGLLPDQNIVKKGYMACMLSNRRVRRNDEFHVLAQNKKSLKDFRDFSV